ncbi:MAG: carbamoyltransferase N-terminal domain-containing protein, partial [Planctomycetota bacterium]
MYILGLTFPIGWNASACLLKDGKLLSFIEEERLNRFRYCHRVPALEGMDYCLQQAGISLDDVKHVAFGWDHGIKLWPHFNPRRYIIRRFLLRMYGPDIRQKTLHFQNHHLSHVASSYFCSDFGESNFISIDSSGGDTSGLLGVARGAKLQVLHKFPVDQSWGYVYENLTEAIGFLPHREEGKTMGLAALGQPDLSKFGFIHWDGELPHIDLAAFKSYLRTLNYRKRGEPLNDHHKFIAATVQAALEKACIMMARWLHKRTGVRRISLAGGCALNCSTNGRLAMLDEVDEVYVQPASHDAGTSLGAALLTHADLTGERPKPQMVTPHMGPEYSNEEIHKAILKCRWNSYKLSQDIASDVADILVQKKVVGWFQGRLEAGPRALGGRSILGDPTQADMKDIINKQIKGREPWRPFA